jgi:hypothetical protein
MVQTGAAGLQSRQREGIATGQYPAALDDGMPRLRPDDGVLVGYDKSGIIDFYREPSHSVPSFQSRACIWRIRL